MIHETIRTIADRTGYSVSTVSRVLSGKGDQYRIATKTQQVILAEAKRCHYSPSMVARGLRTKSTRTLGLIVPNISNPFFWELAGYLSQLARQAGYVTLLVDSAGQDALERDGLTAFRSYNVDGIIMVPSADNPVMIEQVAKDIPLVLVDRYYEHSSVPYVSSMNEEGAYAGTSFLLRKGHRKIAFLQGDPNVITSQKRVQGYLRAMQEYRDAQVTLTGDAFSVECGYQAAMKLATASVPPTAIFAANNTLLFGVLRALKELGTHYYHMQQDLLCFDNPDYMQFFPAIYRIEQDYKGMAEHAFAMLMHRLSPENEKHGELSSMLFPVNTSQLKLL